jgi:hypothetical protein
VTISRFSPHVSRETRRPGRPTLGSRPPNAGAEQPGTPPRRRGAPRFRTKIGDVNPSFGQPLTADTPQGVSGGSCRAEGRPRPISVSSFSGQDLGRKPNGRAPAEGTRAVPTAAVATPTVVGGESRGGRRPIRASSHRPCSPEGWRGLFGRSSSHVVGNPRRVRRRPPSRTGSWRRLHHTPRAVRWAMADDVGALPVQPPCARCGRCSKHRGVSVQPLRRSTRPLLGSAARPPCWPPRAWAGA